MDIDQLIAIDPPANAAGDDRPLPREEVALHKPSIWIDLSGWSPKYFAPQLYQYANTLLRDRILFGSDFPLSTPERWMKDFEEAGFKDEVKPLILKANAARLLGLQAPSAA